MASFRSRAGEHDPARSPSPRGRARPSRRWSRSSPRRPCPGCRRPPRSAWPRGRLREGVETKFERSYSNNPLVNAFALGLVRRDQIFYAKASGEGNPVIYVGAKTGRDGIHGATMASEEFSEASEAKRPNVQVGDPFL